MTDTTTHRLRIKEMPAAERPLYRAQHAGPAAMSSAELLQLVTNCQYMDSLLQLCADAGTLIDLARMTVSEIAEYPNIGRNGAAALKAAFELGQRLLRESQAEHQQVRSPADAYNLIWGHIGLEEQEHFVAVLLDTRNNVLGIETVYKGSANTVVVRAAEVFRAAVRKNAVAIIIGHNHPSGDPSPSPEDVAVTRKIVQAGRALDVEVLDHIIVGRGRFISLKERGLGWDGV